MAELAHEQRGSGAPLVVLNGFAATRADWDPGFLDALAESSELVLVDNRGVGDSAAADGEFTIEDLAADVAGLIEELELERPALLGWSMGGFVSLALALERPELVGALVLLATGPGGEGSTPTSPQVKAELLDLSGTPREQAARLISLLFPPQRAAEVDAEFGELVAAARAELSPDVIEQQGRAMDDWGAAGAGSRLGEIGCPALVATGGEDVVIPPANSVALATGIKDAWLARYPDTGHGFMADRPQALARLISIFLESV